MSWYAIDALEDAYEASKEFLFPFNKWTWLKLAFIAFFVGGGSNPTSFSNFGDPTTDTGASAPDVSIAFVLAVVALLLFLGLLFGFLAAVMEFVLYDSIRNREVKILRYFTRHLWNGVQLFLFRIAVTLVFLLPVILLAIGLVAAFWPVGLVALFILIPVFLLLVLLLVLVLGFTNDFVVPIMMAQDRGVISAWKAYWPNLKEDWKQYGMYALLKFAVSIAVGIIALIAVVAGAIILLLPFAVLALAVIALSGGFDPAAWGTPTLAILLILGVIYFLLFLVYSLLVQVPVITYFRYYALLVLGDSRREFDLIPDQRSEVRADGGEKEESDGDVE